MITVEELYMIIDCIAPFRLAEPYDNVGIIYNSGKATSRVMFTLDISTETIKEAVAEGCGIIVSHHPIIYPSVQNLSYNDLISKAIAREISIIAAHTNYDRASSNTSDVLASHLGVTITERIHEGLGCLGYVSGLPTPKDFIYRIKKIFGLKQVLAVPGTKEIENAAVIAGAAGDITELLNGDISAIICGEIKYHHVVQAKDKGITLIILGHFISEDIGFQSLMLQVEAALGQEATSIYSKTTKDPLEYL
jgi:dinuclear metal center YbgI/SA1388 family protein